MPSRKDQKKKLCRLSLVRGRLHGLPVTRLWLKISFAMSTERLSRWYVNMQWVRQQQSYVLWGWRGCLDVL
jgi:hypothetical protein